MRSMLRTFSALMLAIASIAGAEEDQPAASDANAEISRTHAQITRVIAEKTNTVPKSFEFPALATIPKLNDAGYKAMTTTHGSDLLVVNFWATWCGPCVEELPHFIEVAKQNQPEHVRFVGLSLDMDNQVDSKVIPFLKEKAIPYSNFLLDTDDADAFITHVSEEWSGAIPATMFYDRQGNRVGQLLEPVTKAELEAAIAAALAKAGVATPAGTVEGGTSMSTTVTTSSNPDGTVTTTVTTTKTNADGTSSTDTQTTTGGKH